MTDVLVIPQFKELRGMNMREKLIAESKKKIIIKDRS
jgi:hypothetical protein